MDKEAYVFIKQSAKYKRYPSIHGSQKDKNQFFITLIRTQKALHDWRAMLVDVTEQMRRNGKIDAVWFNSEYPPESIGKDISAWVTYEGDSIVSDFIDELSTRKVEFIGSDEENGEFVLRFILGQHGHDWEQTIILIWEMLGSGNTISLHALNEELKNFDYMRLFT